MSGDHLILIHFLAAGTQTTVVRSAARNRLNAETVAFATALWTLLLAGGALFLVVSEFPFLVYGPSVTGKTLLVGVAGFSLIGFAYFSRSYARFHAHNLLPSYVFEPLARSHVLIVVPVSMVFFEPEASLLEFVGIAAALVPVFVLAVQRPSNFGAKDWPQGLGLIWIGIASLFATALQLGSKLAVDPALGLGVPVLVFMVGSNAATAVVSTIRHVATPHRRQALLPTLRYGAAAGVCNVLAFGSLLLFLVDGKPSRIYSVAAMSMLIPVFVGLLGQQERRPNRLEVLAFGFMLVAIVVQYQVGD